MSGVSKRIYWGANLLFDLAIYVMLIVFLLIIIAALQVDSLTTGGAFVAIIFTALMSSGCVILWAALVSFAFSKRKTVENILPTILIFVSLWRSATLLRLH